MSRADRPGLERFSLRVSGVLELRDAGRAWRLESGEMALFAVPRDEHGRPGARRYLFTVGPDDRLFGFDDGAAPVAILAVALDEVVLAPGLAREASAGGLDRWRAHWATAVEGELPAELGSLQPDVLAAVAGLLDTEAGRDRDRVADRGRHARDTTREAVERLTSVLGATEAIPPQGSPLYVASWLVARAAGITLQPLPPWRLAGGDGGDVESIARGSHVRARYVILDSGWWTRDGGPLVGRAADGTPRAFLPDPRGGYLAVDPDSGERTPIDDALGARLSPEAWSFFRPLPEDAHRGLALLRFALAGRSRDLLTMALCAIAATLLGMVAPVATGLLVDRAIPDADRGLLRDLALGLGAAAFGMAAFAVAQGFAMMRIETGAEVSTQAAVWDRLLKLRLSFFREYSTGDLQSRVEAVGQIRSYLGGTTLRTLFSSVVLLLNLGLLLYYSPTLTIVAAGVAVLAALVTAVSGVAILRWTRQILELRGRFYGLVVQLINGIPKLRVAAAESRAFARWAEQYSTLLGLELRQRRIQDAVDAIGLGLSTTSTIVLFGVAATLALPDASGAPQLSTGAFLAFLGAYGMFTGAVVQIADTVTDVMIIAILRERAEPILTAEPEIREEKADPGELSGRIEMRHVGFRYRPEGANILDDVNIDIGAGEFVAFVGPSGSGKSTLFRLLLGFESPGSGSIFFDGQELSGLDVDAIRRQMGVVLQSGRIGSGSIFENIVSGTRASLDDAWQAARDTGFAEDVESMPMGMHTVVSEGGSNLSGGQRQRLLLARALVHRPRILLLDEATSALDNRTQAIVSRSLERLEVTRLVVAHRLSTIRHADRIFVIERGRIAQSGRFEELAEADGPFARLIARQLA